MTALNDAEASSIVPSESPPPSLLLRSQINLQNPLPRLSDSRLANPLMMPHPPNGKVLLRQRRRPQCFRRAECYVSSPQPCWNLVTAALAILAQLVEDGGLEFLVAVGKGTVEVDNRGGRTVDAGHEQGISHGGFGGVHRRGSDFSRFIRGMGAIRSDRRSRLGLLGE
ncbi:MAG: hypothetical protein Q9196_005728 [Gyalolechia fulgens]